jgi:hypothetical protein
MNIYNVADLIAEELGVQVTTRDNELISSVGAARAMLLKNSPHRVAFLFVNLSPVSMYLGHFNDVATSKAILVGSGGGNVLVWWKEDFDLPTREWWVLADAAASNFLVTGFYLVKAGLQEDHAH